MLNKAILMGRFVANPELRQTPSGVSVVQFRIAVDRNYNPKDGQRKADFIDIVAWRQTAEFVSRYFSKGQMIAVEGSIQTRTYVDKNGNNRYAVEILADRVHFCGSKAESSAGMNQAGPVPSSVAGGEEVAGGAVQPAAQGESFSVGDLSDFEDFEEIGTDDSKLPF